MIPILSTRTPSPPPPLPGGLSSGRMWSDTDAASRVSHKMRLKQALTKAGLLKKIDT